MTATVSERAPGARSGEPILRLRGIEKNFGAVHVLRGVDLDVRPGEVTALVDNGAGKSTLIKGIAGIHGFERASTSSRAGP